MKNYGSQWFNVLNIALMAVIAAVTLFPIYYVFVVSFTAPEEYLQRSIVWFPHNISLESYEYLLSNGAFVRSIGISGFLAVFGTMCSLATTASLAYMVSKKRLQGRRIIMLLILFTILFGPGIIPNYILVKELGLINSLWALILPTLSSGWYVILMKGFFENIPDSLEEAAVIDGCNDISVWLRIILPLSLPAMAAFGLFYAVGYWNMFFQALLYMNDYKKWPIQVLLQNMLNNSASSLNEADPLRPPPPTDNLKMAAVVIATMPILFVYPFLQKHFAKGVMLGSVKG